MDLSSTVRRQRSHAYPWRAKARGYRPAPAGVLGLWIGLLVLVIIGELVPGDSAPMILLSRTYVSDKLVHFTAYTVLALVPALGLRLRSAIPCLITTQLVGISLELAQILVPYRSWDFYDIAANTAGVLAGAILGVGVRQVLLVLE
jgi:VanZ family protein